MHFSTLLSIAFAAGALALPVRETPELSETQVKDLVHDLLYENIDKSVDDVNEIVAGLGVNGISITQRDVSERQADDLLHDLLYENVDKTVDDVNGIADEAGLDGISIAQRDVSEEQGDDPLDGLLGDTLHDIGIIV
ncbi:uncharacterized protein RCC_01802 [Ramularia collo-cygni]|uniref:Uncharacterized protein n=1 Tax=Ramularia collo-cygni TaxID=112498 RepID=A0A2D3UM32_9PEZI|nr:uncharacterized protein RCC_01802 [Ramularia collo-cygni]CZT15962.1 uncharacterized protein RCC_01802 [Ramularia collo-cygni]